LNSDRTPHSFYFDKNQLNDLKEIFIVMQEWNTMDFFLCVLGMVMILEGFPYFAFPEKMKIWVQKVLEMPEGTLRKFGFFLMLIGLWLVYMGRK